jgi:general secretion pathway protein D
VRDASLMTEISETKYNYIRADQIRKQEEGLSLMSNENIPILPQWQDKLTLPPSFEEYQKQFEETGIELPKPPTAAEDKQ